MKTVEFRDGKVVLIDQTLLPGELKFIQCEDIECVAEAIESLRVRGAPAIGVTAAFGLAMVALQSKGVPKEKALEAIEQAAERLKRTRPTAVNLFWAIERVMERARTAQDPVEAVEEEALRMYQEDLETNRKIGEHGADLLQDGDRILTHCNAGALATAGVYGTALAPVKVAKEQGKRVEVYADETRPLLQGARLTAFEMVQEDIPVTVLTDGMAAFAMKKEGITKVIVGADRIAANGDTANKIGTCGVAVLAKEFGVPFYVAAPLSTIDRATPTGEEIPIEFRDRGEMEFFNGKRVVPEGAEVLNPAFDVTPSKYIAGIITEKGVLRPPFEESIRKAFEGGNP
jgi:methylthioribose-1-phosphate isomerase